MWPFKDKSVWNFFDYRVCLTTVETEWFSAQKEFDRVGLQVEKFKSIPHALGGHQSFNISEKAIFQQFFDSGKKVLLHLEDDVQFKDFGHLNEALKELPRNWDILYLGANVFGNDTTNWRKPERISKHLYRVYNAWTTHAVAYRREVIEYILKNVPGESECMVDGWIGENVLPNFRCFVVSPMIAWQRPHYSHIWKQVVDYNGVFAESQKRLV